MSRLPAPAPTEFTVNADAIKDPAAAQAIRDLARQITAEFAKVDYVDRPQSVYAYSPDGTLYSIVVANGGAISATKIR